MDSTYPHTLSPIPLKSRAAILIAFKQPLELKDDWPVTQLSELAPGECLIELEYAGCCQSDLHIRDNDWGADASIPLIAGHEGVGRIVGIGEHTYGHRINVGDRVGVKFVANACLRSAPRTLLLSCGTASQILSLLVARCAVKAGMVVSSVSRIIFECFVELDKAV